jgi:hypothetical protein
MSISSLGMALKVPTLGVGLDSATVAYQAAIASAGGTISNASIVAIDALVKGLKADGLWSLLHEIYPFAGNFTAALVKLKTVTAQPTLTNVNFVSGDYNEASGLKGNGTSKYLKTGYISGTDGVLNSASAGYWNFDTTEGQMAFGANDGTSTHQFLAPRGGGDGGKLFSDCYAGNRVTSAASVAAFRFLSMSRTSSTSHIGFANGTSIGSNTTANTEARPTREYYLFARNFNLTPDGYSAYRMSFCFFGLGLTNPQMLSLYNRVLAYCQAMGRA